MLGERLLRVSPSNASKGREILRLLLQHGLGRNQNISSNETTKSFCIYAIIWSANLVSPIEDDDSSDDDDNSDRDSDECKVVYIHMKSSRSSTETTSGLSLDLSAL